ncbi:unnamed protein product [Choristocarpus tenellus]
MPSWISSASFFSSVQSPDEDGQKGEVKASTESNSSTDRRKSFGETLREARDLIANSLNLYKDNPPDELSVGNPDGSQEEKGDGNGHYSRQESWNNLIPALGQGSAQGSMRSRENSSIEGHGRRGSEMRGGSWGSGMGWKLSDRSTDPPESGSVSTSSMRSFATDLDWPEAFDHDDTDGEEEDVKSEERDGQDVRVDAIAPEALTSMHEDDMISLLSRRVWDALPPEHQRALDPQAPASGSDVEPSGPSEEATLFVEEWLHASGLCPTTCLERLQRISNFRTTHDWPHVLRARDVVDALLTCAMKVCVKWL